MASRLVEKASPVAKHLDFPKAPIAWKWRTVNRVRVLGHIIISVRRRAGVVSAMARILANKLIFDMSGS